MLTEMIINFISFSQGSAQTCFLHACLGTGLVVVRIAHMGGVWTNCTGVHGTIVAYKPLSPWCRDTRAKGDARSYAVALSSPAASPSSAWGSGGRTMRHRSSTTISAGAWRWTFHLPSTTAPSSHTTRLAVTSPVERMGCAQGHRTHTPFRPAHGCTGPRTLPKKGSSGAKGAAGCFFFK